MKVAEMKTIVKIPEGITVSVEEGVVVVKGPKGEVKRNLVHPMLNISSKDGEIVLIANNASKREKTIMGTFKSHIHNLIDGAQNGFTYRLKICSGHFPMKVTVKGNEFVVQNFLGERIPRVIMITDGAKVAVDGDIVKVEGIDLEIVAQCAASIEQMTRIANRDRRIFMDGIWIIDKRGKELK